VGGMRAGARFFALEVADPARLDDAVAQIFRVTNQLTHADSASTLAILGAQRQRQLLDGFESVADRGTWCADYLQFSKAEQFHLDELKALQEIDAERIHARARRLVPQASRVVHVLPAKGDGHTARAQLQASAARIDLPVWRAPVDPAEADRPLALPADRRSSAISEFQLENGLRVVMDSDFTQPVFEARLVFPVGETSAGVDQAVTAQAAAELLDHDRRRGYSLGDFLTLQWVFGLGARLSTEVNDHTTVFEVRGSSLFADWHIWRLYWLLDNGMYDYAGVMRVRERASRAARKAGRHDEGRGRRRALRESLFGRDHPYAQDTHELAKLAALDIDDLYRFRDTYYRAQGATLIVVGNFNPTVVKRTVTELFGAWPKGSPPAAVPVPAMHPAAGPTWIAHADPKASQIRITFDFAATSPRMASRGVRAVVAAMVDDRLEQARTRLGASYGIETGYQLTDAGDLIEVDGKVDADRAGEVVRQMQADLEGLRAGDAMLAADFVRARRAALARALADPIKSSTAADRLEAAAGNQLPIDAAQTLPAEIARVTLAEARQVIAQDLKPERMLVLLSGRPADTAAALAAAGVTRFRSVTDDPAKPSR
jgi:zinc protease